MVSTIPEVDSFLLDQTDIDEKALMITKVVIFGRTKEVKNKGESSKRMWIKKLREQIDDIAKESIIATFPFVPALLSTANLCIEVHLGESLFQKKQNHYRKFNNLSVLDRSHFSRPPNGYASTDEKDELFCQTDFSTECIQEAYKSNQTCKKRRFVRSSGCSAYAKKKQRKISYSCAEFKTDATKDEDLKKPIFKYNHRVTIAESQRNELFQNTLGFFLEENAAMFKNCEPNDKKQSDHVTKEEWKKNPEHFIQRKLDEYSQSFTIHGLSRSLRSKKAESLFWITMLFAGILCAFIVIYGLVKKYNSHVVYTELTSRITDENLFPSITVCEETLLKQAYFAYCGKSINIDDQPCDHYSDFRSNLVSRSDPWATELFNVTSCFSWGSKRCDNDTYFTTKTKLNNSCITWNYNGTFHDTYGHVDIKFDFLKPTHMTNDVQIFAIPHDPNILEIDLTKKVEIDADHKYEIKIDKTYIKRLPAPYPSNCTDGEGENIFEGKYTRFNCIESHYYIDMYKRCGDVFDYVKKYIPASVVEKYGGNNTNVQSCLRNYTQRELRNIKRCQFACEVLDLNYFTTFQLRRMKREGNNDTNVLRYQVGIQLKTANEYKVMEEKQLYTLSQMACEIGGFVGLIMGMSMISLIEIVVFIVLSIAKRVVCMTKTTG